MILKMKLELVCICLIAGLLNSYAVEVKKNVAGSLSTLVEDKGTTELVVKGEIDARDLKFISEELVALESLDLSGAKIMACKVDKPCFGDMFEYSENTLPDYCFFAKGYKSVALPSQLIEIGEGAFAGCKRISTIELPSSIKTIGKYAFSACASLSHITLSLGVESVADGAFMRCESLKTVDMGALTTNSVLGERVFADCVSLESVKIGESVRMIPARAFSGCVSLSTIDFGDVPALESVGEEAFASTAIKYFDLEKLKNVKNIGDWAFAGMSNSQIVVPEGVISIGEGAFLANEAVNNVVLPSSLTEIGSYAFAGDALLSEMSVSAVNVPTLGDAVWQGVNQGEVTVTVPEESVESYRVTNQWCEFKIVGDATTIGDVNGLVDLRTYFLNGCLVIESSIEIERVEVYDASGVCCVAATPMTMIANIDMRGAQVNIYVASIFLKNGKTKTIKLIKQ